MTRLQDQIVFGSQSIFEIIQDIAEILRRFLRILYNLSHPNSMLLSLQGYEHPWRPRSLLVGLDIAKQLGKISQENSSLSLFFPTSFFLIHLLFTRELSILYYQNLFLLTMTKHCFLYFLFCFILFQFILLAIKKILYNKTAIFKVCTK